MIWLRTVFVAHAIDSVSKFQMAEVLKDKSADAVVNFDFWQIHGFQRPCGMEAVGR